MKICPHCGHEIFCPEVNCPWCGCRIEHEFSIFVFVKENFTFFQAIGIIATILALLPIFSELMLGSGWQFENDSNSVAPLIFTIIFGLLLIIGIYLKIIIRLYSKNESYVKYSQNADVDLAIISKFLQWLSNNVSGLKRHCFAVFFSLFIFSFVHFFLTIAIETKSELAFKIVFPIVISTIALFYILLCIFLLAGLCVTNLKMLQNAQRNLPPTLFTILLVTFVFLLIGGFCIHIFFPEMTDISRFFPKKDYPKDISFDFDGQFLFNPTVSTTNGILLIPTNVTDSNIETFPYWKTNYGYFVSETFPDKKIRIEGKEIIPKQDTPNLKKKIYWVYPKTDIGKQKPNVSIYYGVLPGKKNTAIADASLIINWMDMDTAQVDVHSIKWINYENGPINNTIEEQQHLHGIFFSNLSSLPQEGNVTSALTHIYPVV